MTSTKKEPETPFPLGQFVKMTGPVFIFGVILPFVDMVTDLRMIIRLYGGVPGCAGNYSLSFIYCVQAEDFDTYCLNNPGRCATEQHPIFASILLGKLKMLFRKINENFIWDNRGKQIST